MLETNTGNAPDAHNLAWNLMELYPTPEECETAIQEVRAQILELELLEPIGTDVQEVHRALEMRDEMSRTLGRAALYAQVWGFQNIHNTNAQALQKIVGEAQTEVGRAISFIASDISVLPHEALMGLVASEQLQTYQHELQNIARKKDHIQSSEVEFELVTLEGKERQSAIAGKYAEVQDRVNEQTPRTIDEQGKKIPSSAALYGNTDRSVRERAYNAIHKGLYQERNALAEIYEYKVEGDNRAAEMRKFNSSLEAHFFADNVPVSVYEQLINTVDRKGIPLLQEYQELRRDALGYRSLYMHDIVAPFIVETHHAVSFEQAVNMAKGALSPIGEITVYTIDKAMQEGWIDAYKTPGKRSGARTDFAPSAPHPFVLLNMTPDNANPYQFIHEVGAHATNFYLSSDLPSHEAYPSVFTGEAVALCNEQLLTEYLLAATTDDQERITVLTQSLDVMHRGFFRQTMFAEFEQGAHRAAQEGKRLTADILDEIYLAVNKKYYGNTVTVDTKIGNEWGRLQNFFYQPSFYVYTYATGVAAAVCLTEQILHGGQVAVDRYIELLKSGSSDYSVELLKHAGVDMATSQPVEQVLNLFARRTNELRLLLQKHGGEGQQKNTNTREYIAQ